MMNVSRLEWISREKSSTLSHQLNNTLATWQSGWSLIPVTIQVSHISQSIALDANPSDWMVLGVDATGEPVAWVQGLMADADNPCSHWLGIDAKGVHRSASETIMESALRSAETSLLDDLRAAFQLRAPEHSTCGHAEVIRKLRPWSGAARFELSGAGAKAVVGFSGKILSGAGYAATNEDRPHVSRPTAIALSQAVHSEKVCLSVTLSDLQIALGDIAGLRVGDVLKTDHLVATALRLNDAAGSAITRVSLGCHGTAKAIRFLE